VYLNFRKTLTFLIHNTTDFDTGTQFLIKLLKLEHQQL